MATDTWGSPWLPVVGDGIGAPACTSPGFSRRCWTNWIRIGARPELPEPRGFFLRGGRGQERPQGCGEPSRELWTRRSQHSLSQASPRASQKS